MLVGSMTLLDLHRNFKLFKEEHLITWKDIGDIL